MDTYLYLWSKNGQERPYIDQVPGYCLPHLGQLIGMAHRLPGGKRRQFLLITYEKQSAYMKALEEDLEWFTLKFDYRNAAEPWKNSKDALPRAIQLIGGWQEGLDE